MMGYSGGKIGDLTEKALDAVEPAMRQMVSDGGKEMTARVKENTPVGEPQPPMKGRQADHVPGHLRDSIEQKPLIKEGEYWVSGVETEVIYAPFVEEGTGLWGPEHRRYRIEPKDPNGVLAFYTRSLSPEGKAMVTGSYNQAEGTLVFRKYVMHPGSPGQHMFAIGAASVEANFDQVTADGLREWKARTES